MDPNTYRVFNSNIQCPKLKSTELRTTTIELNGVDLDTRLDTDEAGLVSANSNIATLQTKTQNVTATAGSTLLTGNVSIGAIGTLPLKVTGNAEITGSVKFASLSAWTPETSMGGNNSTGYYIFPNGLCIQWTQQPDPGNNVTNWTFPKPMTNYYCCVATAAPLLVGTNSATLKIRAISTTAVQLDTAFGSGDKDACYILVIGKV